MYFFIQFQDEYILFLIFFSEGRYNSLKLASLTTVKQNYANVATARQASDVIKLLIPPLEELSTVGAVVVVAAVVVSACVVVERPTLHWFLSSQQLAEIGVLLKTKQHFNVEK